MTHDGPVCACGRRFTLPAHLGRHRPACLGANPTLADLYRVGKVTVTAEGCHEWNAKRHQHGYGVLADAATEDHGERRAHRLAYRLAVGPIPDGLNVLHRCDNPPCIRPEHLRPGTQADNSADMTERDRHRGRFVPVDLEDRTCPICETAHHRRPGDRQQTCSLSCAAKLGWRTRTRTENTNP